MTHLQITLNDDRFGDKQTFSSFAELDASVALCAVDWYQSLDREDGQSLEDYTAECCAEARGMATVTDVAPSRKLVAKWSGELKVGIYERCAWSVRLYEDRAIVRMPYVKWANSSGTLAFWRTVVSDSPTVDAFARLTRDEASDDAVLMLVAQLNGYR
jgi:hypothetical protein